jgi:hypothetical protein
MTTSYLELYQADPQLRIFVDAEVARAVVELAALRAECQRMQSVINAQAQTIRDLQADLKRLGTEPSRRQRALKAQAS